VKRRPEQGDNADKRGKTSASDPELEYFARTMADVVRLAPDPRGRVRAAPQISAPREATPSTSSSAGQDNDESSEVGFVAPGVDRRELRKLRRGDLAPGSQLDLHGMTAAEAVASVKRFIDNGRHCHRCVCIVHGRGLHSEGNVSILKRLVRECLRQHRAVLAYADAPRAGGGAGAVYVLLRKIRSQA
jgi:DNA-nicking Smr family endonuclease